MNRKFINFHLKVFLFIKSFTKKFSNNIPRVVHLIDMKFHWVYLSHFKLDLFLTYFKTGFVRDLKKEDKLGIIKRSESRKPKIFTKHLGIAHRKAKIICFGD